MTTHEIKSHLGVLLATMLVAGSFLVSEKLAGLINPFSLTLLRFVGASVILMPFVLLKKKWRKLILSTLKRTMIVSLFYSAFFISFFESLKTTSALNTGTLFTLVPLMTALLSALVFKNRVTSKQIWVYFLGALGTIWVVFEGQVALLTSFSLNKGDLIFMIAVLSMCCNSISMKLLYRDDPMIVFVFCTLLGGSFWMVLALLLTGQPLQWHIIQGDSVLHMFYLILPATLVTGFLFQKTTVHLGPSRVNAYIYLNPAFVAILLFVIEDVSIAAVLIPGILISSIATVILQDRKKSQVYT